METHEPGTSEHEIIKDPILYIDLASGASGDKLLAALLQVGEETGAFYPDTLRRGLESVVPEARIELGRVRRGGLGGYHVSVEADYAPKHRGLSEIRDAIEGSNLPDGAKHRALAAFMLLGEAEAKVHGVTCEEVHFHEVGATDSMVDIIGVSLALDLLQPSALICSPIAVGSGTLSCAHGTLPVPAPAVAEILRGAPLYSGAAQGELTTPTGAALVMTNLTEWGPMPSMLIVSIGYGAGTKEFEGLPNILRLIAGTPVTDSQREAPYFAEGLILLETNIDHISSEAIAFSADEIMKAGALDVWQTPIVMKKGRSATKLSALVRPSDSGDISRKILESTGSLGVRSSWVERTCAPREVRELDTLYGPCRFKVARFDGTTVVRPEHDDIARISCEREKPYREVADELEQLGRSLLDI